MYTKRTISALLAILMMLASVSCGGGSTASGETSVDAGNADATTTAATATRLTANVPDTKYDGYELRIMSGTLATDFQNDEIYAETETGDVVNDAVFQRNRMVEEKFDVTIKRLQSSGIATDIGTYVLSGDDAFDAALPTINSISALISNEYLLSADDLPYLDISKPWWNHGIIDSSTVAGKNFFFVGDIGFRWREATWALCFNKRLYEENNLEEPYSMVRDGKWTMSVLREHCKNLTKDINGDTILDKNDQWGLLSSRNAGIGLVTSANIITIVRDGDGLKLNIGTERNINALGAIREFMTDNSLQLRAEDIGGANMWTDIINIFREGRALYRISIMTDIVGLRDMEDDFGILPLPKYEESDTYTNTLQGWNANAYVVPVTVSDAERTSALLEYMASVSPDTVTTAYYDRTLEGKVARDDDSGEMLDIIFGNMITDLGLAYEWGGMRSVLGTIINSDSDVTVSTIDSNKDAMQSKIDEFIEALG